MKLTYYLAFLLFSIIPFTTFSQNATVPVADDRIIEVYGQEYINTLSTENPFLIKRWNYYLDHAFYISDDVPEKSKDFETITVVDIENINILKLEKEQNIGKAWDLPKAYKIANTNKLLIYHPGKNFNERLREHLAKE